MTEPEPFVNENCPGECEVDHPELRPNGDGQAVCPDGDIVYDWCDPCNEWSEHGYYSDTPRYIQGDFHCESCAQFWSSCDSCGEDIFLENGDYYTDDWGNHTACSSSCLRDLTGEEEEQPPEETCLCRTCLTANNHLDETTEELLCDCQARARRDDGVPVYKLGEKS